MSSFDRRGMLALFGVLPLAACGFTPVYGPGGPGERLRGRISVTGPESGLAFAFVGRIEDRLGRAESAPYHLDYTIQASESLLGVTGTEDVNRINIFATADYTVTEVASGTEVQSGEVSTFSAFATSGSLVATSAARRDAGTRVMVALADQLVTRLIAGASAWP